MKAGQSLLIRDNLTGRPSTVQSRYNAKLGQPSLNYAQD